MTVLGLRRGDLVEVRSAGEILATLDEDGALDAVPFMPEMIAYCGRRFTVDRRAQKLCDSIQKHQQSREMVDAVLLDDLRCDGAAHGGCQAACRYYWKEAWLRPAGESSPALDPVQDGEAREDLRTVAERNATRASVGAEVRYRCQATEMLAATAPLSTSDPRPYIREWTSGNVGLLHFLYVMPRAFVMQVLNRFSRLPWPPLVGPSAKSPTTQLLDLQPGEWVRVKSKEQVQATLTKRGMNRGLWFDREMVKLCGKAFRVKARITKFIDEGSGEMINLQSDCVSLDGAVCSREWSPGRWFCPRRSVAYFRECWLERIERPPASRG